MQDKRKHVISKYNKDQRGGVTNLSQENDETGAYKSLELLRNSSTK